MNTSNAHDEAFDRAMRGLHAQAITQVSARTRARLRAARTTASTRPAAARGLRWAVASGFAAIFAVAIAVQWWGPSSTGQAPTRTAAIDAADYGAMATFDENPDLYLWLASNDDTLPSSSER